MLYLSICEYFISVCVCPYESDMRIGVSHRNGTLSKNNGSLTIPNIQTITLMPIEDLLITLVPDFIRVCQMTQRR